MGWSKFKGTKNEYWGDGPQDLIDDYLKKIGYDYKKEYTDAQKMVFYRRTVKNKTLRKHVNEWYKTSNLKRNAKETEWKKSIKMGLRFRL